MAEQQLVDYIKKAKEAGQTDEQTRSLLFKNGWTENEVTDAFSALVVQPQVQAQVQTQPQTQAQPVAQVQPKIQTNPVSMINETKPEETRRSPIKAVVVGLAVFIVIIGLAFGGYYVAGMYINLPWNPFWPNPETILNKSLENSLNIKTGSSDSTISLAYDNGPSQAGKATLYISSKQDISDIKNPKASISLQFKDVSISGLPSIDFSSAKVDLVMIGSTIYLKLSDSPIWDSLNPQASQLKGVWIKIDESSLKSFIPSEGQVSMVGSENITYDPEIIKKVQNIIVGQKIFSVTKQLADESINGKSTYHYTLKISKEKLTTFISKILEEQLKAGQSNLSEQEITMIQGIFSATVGVFVNYIGDIDYDVWIGKTDKIMYKSVLNKDIDLAKFSVFGDKDMAGNLKIKVEVINSDINKPITIQEPAESQNLEDLIGPARQINKIKSAFLSVDGLAAQFFTTNKSFYSLCKSKSLTDTLASATTAGASSISCFAQRSAYCVSAKLPDGSYVCMSSKGVLGKAKCLTASSICQ